MPILKLINLSIVLIMGIIPAVFADDLSGMNNPANWQALQTMATQAAYAIQTDSNEDAMKPTSQPITIKSFPIVTPLMTPGTQQTLNKPTISFIQPVFILGSDDLSKTWLKQNIEQLKSAHAIGFLVQAQNQTDIDEMKQLAEGLLLIPASGNIFAQKLKLQHYPVLITKNGIEQ